MRIKSPGYPNVNLRQAADSVGRLFAKNRRNVIDREAATKDIGYSGLTGASAKMLSNLAHFGLIEKAGKGGLRVTDLAVKLLVPDNVSERTAALIEAAYSPELFAAIKERWPDGLVSENALSGYLMREGFSPVAVAPAVTSYLETYAYLQQENATESHGISIGQRDNELRDRPSETSSEIFAQEHKDEDVLRSSPSVHRRGGVQLMDGERVVFVDELGPEQYLKLIANGEVDEGMLEALEDFIKRQKKRLERSKSVEH